MRFAFTEDQTLFRDAARDMLARECPATAVRAAWTNETGRTESVWAQLAEMGVLAMTAPEQVGGLGMSEADTVLILEEAGFVALPEPVADTVSVGVPLLVEHGGAAGARWLEAAVGGGTIAIGLASERFVVGAEAADVLLIEREGAVWAVPREAARIEAARSVDGSRRLSTVDFSPAEATCLVEGAAAAEAVAVAFDRAALAAAAQLVGLSRRMLDMAVEYAKMRRQFGKPIGAQQAIQHHLANALVALTFAQAPTYRAAWSMSAEHPDRALHVSTAKAIASEAAVKISKIALQVHGAIGYSYEYDLHLWMKRAWALSSVYGDARWHRERLARHVLDGESVPEWS